MGINLRSAASVAVLSFACGCFMSPLGGEPASPGKRPADRAARIDSLVAEAGVRPESPGLVILVARGGLVLFEKGYGLANIESGRPATVDTQYYIASNSKAFTAMAIMMLAERGQLSYDDPLTKFFPEFPRYARRITVRHLLHHTSGLPDYEDFFDDSSAIPGQTSAQLLTAMSRQPEPNFVAGQQYEYSNSGYFMLAMIVDKVARRKLPDFVKENIFAPLSMKDSFMVAERKASWPQLATPYVLDGGTYHDARFGDDPIDLTYGDGGVVSTVGDLLKWDQALYSDKLVKSTTLEQAFVSGRLNNGEETDYGFGWEVEEYLGHPVIHHSGSWTGWNSVVARFPDVRLTVIILAGVQPFDPTELGSQIASLYLEDSPRPN